MFNGNFSVCLSAHLRCPYLTLLLNCQSSLQIKKISLLSNVLKVLDLIAITKWHTDWEFKLFFYIYRKYSISIFYMHITKGNSKINKSPSLVVCYRLTADSSQLREIGEWNSFLIMQRSDLYCFSFRLSLQLLQKTIMNLIIPLTKYIRISILSLSRFITALSVPLQFSHSVMSDSLRPHGLQHTRPPGPSPTPRAYSNSCPLSQWCHPTISSSVVPFSSHLQSFPGSESFPMSWFFASGGQSIGISASASVFPSVLNTQDWFSLGLTGWISLQSKGLSRVFSNNTVQKHQFFAQFLLINSLSFFIVQLSHLHMTKPPPIRYLRCYILIKKQVYINWIFFFNTINTYFNNTYFGFVCKIIL